MKKYILLVIFILFVNETAFATDACDRLVPQEANFVGKVTMGSNLRSYPCVSKSTIHGVSKVGDIYQVISKVDGYYQVELSDGSIYRIWEKAITSSSESMTYTESETVEVAEEETGYQLTLADKRIVNKFMLKVEKVVLEKGEAYRDNMVSKLQDIVDEGKYSERLIAILDEIKDRIIDIEIVSSKYEKTEPVYEIDDSNSTTKKEEESTDNESNYDTYTLDDIDISEVKSAWLSWYNEVREDLGLDAYTYNSALEETAVEWSELAKDRGEITHQRDTGDSYYDYTKITSWFKDRGVVCENIYGVTHSENIGYGYFTCNDSDCTDEIIGGIESTFDFYMSEKNSSYKPHYESIINSYFTQIGLGIELEETSSGRYKYYLTVHYCTELVD